MSAYARREVTVNLQSGLHMIPCSLIVRRVADFDGDVTLKGNGRIADAKSVLDLMTLKATQGSVLILEAKGTDAEDLVAGIAKMFEENFPLPKADAVSSPAVDERRT